MSIVLLLDRVGPPPNQPLPLTVCAATPRAERGGMAARPAAERQVVGRPLMASVANRTRGLGLSLALPQSRRASIRRAWATNRACPSALTLQTPISH